MRRQVAIAAVLLAPLLASCSGDDEPGRPTSDKPPAEAITVQRLLDVDPATFPVLRTRLPWTVPDEDAELPSVLDDPPGRALLTYHPPETWFTDPSGWATEDIYFYGDDDEWRILRMEDLGLPDSAWFADTYGPGTLSPDGRWWIAPSGLGVILLDLSTAESKVLALPGNKTQAELEWIPGQAAFVAMTYRGRKDFGFEVSVPGGKATRVPFLPHQVGYEPDGTAISMQSLGGGQVRVLEWSGGRRVERFVAPIPSPGRGRGVFGVLATHGRLLTSASATRDNYNKNTLTVSDSETGEVQAVLRYRQRRVPVEAYLGWLDPNTFLLQTRIHVLAWRPIDQKIYRVMEIPEAMEDLYWTLDVRALPGLAGR
jgi:hypothetical protein